MPNPAAALQTLSSVAEQRTVVDGYVSTTHPAPKSFTDNLYVIVPEHSTTVPLGPCDWGAIHGDTLPAQGAAVVVAFDEREVPVVVWWEGSYTVPLVIDASLYLKLDGVTDDGPALNVLLEKLTMSEGQEAVIAFPDQKTLALGTTVKRRPFVSLRGEGAHIKVLAALNAGPVFTNSTSEKMVRSDVTGFTIEKGGLTGTLFDCHSMQNSRIEVKRMIGGTEECTNLYMKCDGTVEVDGDAKSNTVFNQIELIDNGSCGYHMRLQGQEKTAIEGGSGHAVVTLNDFHNITARNVYKGGIDIIEWSDDNFWSGMTTMSLKGTKSFGLRLNGSATPAADVGVYCNQFNYLTSEQYGTERERKGIVLNFSRGTVIRNYFADPQDGAPGTAIENNHSQSHMIDRIGTPSSTEIRQVNTPVEIFEVGSTPATPSAGFVKMFFKEKKMYVKTSDGVEHLITASPVF